MSQESAGKGRDVRIVVDWNECEGNAMCMGVAPEYFDVDDEGQLHLLQDEPDEADRAKVEQAVRSCPKAALKLEA
jgi:ferredoxin